MSLQKQKGHLELTSQLLGLVVPRCCDEKKPVQLVAVDCFEAIYLILLQFEGCLHQFMCSTQETQVAAVCSVL